MGHLMTHRGGTAMILAGAAMTLANINPAYADRRMTLPVGTVIPVKLDQSLNSKHAQPGDRFTATVKEGVDDAGLPIGTRVEGIVREAMPSRDGKAGALDVEFRRIVIPGNSSQTIDGTLYTLNGKDVQRRDGRLVASADKGKDRMKWIGIGAGAGALIGTLAKGNVLFDALLGAGAGYLYNELQSKKAGDVDLKQGTEFGVRLDRAVAFNIDDRAYSRYQDRLGSDWSADDRYYDEGNRETRDRESRDRETRDRNRDRYYDDRYYRSGNREYDRSYDRYYDRSRGNDDASYRNSVNRNGDIGLVIDRREVRFGSTKPFMRNDVVFLPLEPISKAFDTGYRYDAGDRLIRARNGNVRTTVGSRVAFINGERRVMPAASEVRDGVIYVPIQFVGWLTNGSASWDSDSRTVIVTTDR